MNSIETEAYLLKMWHDKGPELYIRASCDRSRKKNVFFTLDEDVFGTGAIINYNKAKRRFDYIEYYIYGFACQFSI